jgi:hypothetical protein
MKKSLNLLALLLILIAAISCQKTTTTVTNTNVRLINLSPNAGAMDVYGNSALIVGGVSYGSASSYQKINSTTPSLTISLTGTSTVLLNGGVNFSADNYYSTIVYDSVAIIKGDVFKDDRTLPPAGKTFIRFFDYVSGTSSIDIIVAGSTTNKLFSGRNYLDHNNAGANYTSYTAFDPGPFSVSAVVAGTNVVITQLPSFEATAGKSYTLVLKGFYKGTGSQAVYLGPITDQ